ncbi:O-antigen ligase family protein [Shewanella frigidimarina]|uniref:O-antigen ligase family protein n=1 Tax=Shewanella frigidimarina TaxID=56812 RepID=UPI003D799BCF
MFKKLIIKNSFVANSAFFILFSGFFFYQILVATGIIFPYLGAYWGVANFILLPSLLFVYLLSGKLSVERGNVNDLFVFAYISYFFIILLSNGLLLEGNNKIVWTHFSSLIQFLTIFLIFRMIEIEKKHFVVLCLLCWLTMSCVILYYGVNGGANFQRNSAMVESDAIASYQEIGFVYFIFSTINILFIKNKLIRYLFYIVAMMSLFLNGSRSDLGAFLVVLLVLEFFLKTLKIKFLWVFLLILLVPLTIEYAINFFPDSRVLGLLTPSNDGSVSERLQMFEQGLNTLDENPFLGDYGSYQPGHYIHNILSVWVDLGLLGFLIYSSLVFFSLCYAIYQISWLHSKSKYLILSLCFLSVSVVLLILSKNFTYLMVPAGLGLLSNFTERNK